MGKGVEGMGSGRGETRAAPMHREHQDEDTSNLVSPAPRQVGPSQLEKVVSFHRTSPLPPKKIPVTARKARSGKQEGTGRRQRAAN